MSDLHRRLLRATARGLPLLLLATAALPAAAANHGELGKVAHGAAAIGAIIQRHYAYPTAYHLMRAALESNLAHGRDSDAFRLGAHLAIAWWASTVPEDLPWRTAVLGRHTDLVTWLTPRVAASAPEVAATVMHAAKLPPASKGQLLEWLRSPRAVSEDQGRSPHRRPTAVRNR